MTDTGDTIPTDAIPTIPVCCSHCGAVIERGTKHMCRWESDPGEPWTDSEQAEGFIRVAAPVHMEDVRLILTASIADRIADALERIADALATVVADEFAFRPPSEADGDIHEERVP